MRKETWKWSHLQHQGKKLSGEDYAESVTIIKSRVGAGRAEGLSYDDNDVMVVAQPNLRFTNCN